MKFSELFFNPSNPSFLQKDWKVVSVYGENFLVNRWNIDEQRQFECPVEGQADLYYAGSAFLFVFHNHLFEFTGVKEVKIIDEEKASPQEDSKYLLFYGTDELIYFFHLSLSNTNGQPFPTAVKKLLGIIPHSCLAPFDYSSFDAHRYNRAFHALTAGISKNPENGYYYPDYSNLSNFHSSACQTAIFRFDAQKLEIHSFKGNYAFFSHVHDHYLKTEKEIFHLNTFTAYSIEDDWLLQHCIPDYWKKNACIPYHSLNAETFFLWKTQPNPHDFAAFFTKAKKTSSGNSISATATCSAADSEVHFWRPSLQLRPHITYKETGEKTLYRIWYQLPITKEISCFTTEKKPKVVEIDAKNEIKKEILFFEVQDYNGQAGTTSIMLILDSNHILVGMETNVTLHRYFSLGSSVNPPNGDDYHDKHIKEDSYFCLRQNSILILENLHIPAGKFTCYFATDSHVDSSFSFYHYKTLYERCNGFTLTALKVLIATSDFDNQEYYLDLKKRTFITPKEALRKSLQK